MSRQTLAVALTAAAVVVAIVVGILFSTRGNRVALTGEVLKVRSQQIGPEQTIVLIDVRVHNPSTQQFLVRELEVSIEEPGGKSVPAGVFSESEITRLLDYYRTLGTKYNPGLIRRDRINSQQTVDRTVAVSAPMNDERFGKRKQLRFIVHDADGPKTEFVERR